MLHIEFETEQQIEIAGMLWDAETEEDVNQILEAYGIEAVVVREMMVAATYDTTTDLRTATRYLKKFRLKKC